MKEKQLLLTEQQQKYLLSVVYNAKSQNVVEAGFQVSMYQMIEGAPDHEEPKDKDKNDTSDLGDISKDVEILDGEG